MPIPANEVHRIAMIGATQGSGLEALLSIVRRSPKAKPVKIHALVRNKSKLHAALMEAGFDANALLDNTDGHKTRSTSICTHEGDALQAASVRDFFQTIVEDGPLSDVVSSIGAYPILKWQPTPTLVFPKGLEGICSDSMKLIVDALATVVAPKQPDGKVPMLIVVSSNGIGQSTYNALPLLLKPFYGSFLKNPHADKEKMERYLHASYGLSSVDFNPTPTQPCDGLLSSRLIIVRPSLLTHGDAKRKVRASTPPLQKAWWVSRKDIGAFLAGDCLCITEKISDTAVQGGHGYTVSY